MLTVAIIKMDCIFLFSKFLAISFPNVILVTVIYLVWQHSNDRNSGSTTAIIELTDLVKNFLA